MKCPNCDKEPFKLFKLKSSGLGIWKGLRGYTRCIHCEAVLKRKYRRPFWITMIFTLAVYAAIYILLWFQPIDMSIFPAWFFIFLLVVMIILMAGTAFTAVFFMNFEEVPEKEKAAEQLDV